jgi:hypothetical protein
MPPDVSATPSLPARPFHDFWVRLALFVWLVVLAAVGGRAWVQPAKRTLYTTWVRVGSEWENRLDLYHQHWSAGEDQFRYSPLAAVLFTPFHHLPLRPGAVLWRLLNGLALLGGFACWLHAAPVPRTARQQAILFLLLAPLSLSSLNNGQPNPLVIGLLLAALAAADSRHWLLSAVLVSLACALKVYPLALGLLLAAAYPRRFAPWLLLTLVLALVLPFLCGPADYVGRQYALWMHRLDVDQRSNWPLHMAYRDLWLLIRLGHLPVTPKGYLGMQLLTAAGCAVLCVAGRWRGWPRRHVLLAVLALGSCWMILCGPATESSTYVLLAPALAWAVVAARCDTWPGVARYLTAGALVLLMMSVLAGLSPKASRFHALGPQPLGTLLLSAAYGVVLVGALRTSSPDCRARVGESARAA